MPKIRVVVVGAAGKMGREVVRAVTGADDMWLVGAVDQNGVGEKLGGVKISKDVSATIEKVKPDVIVDFTHPTAAAKNVHVALLKGVCAVVGTTGIPEKEIRNIRAVADKKRIGVLIAPNFAIGAVLLMKMSKELAPHFAKAEIIELHHDRKADAPSGTAIATANKINEGRKGVPVASSKGVTEIEKVKGARGGTVGDVHIHSVRLPGYVAHQEVIFGGLGQTLSLRHDTISREAFMPGVLLAIRKVRALKGLVIGLDGIL